MTAPNDEGTWQDVPVIIRALIGLMLAVAASVPVLMVVLVLTLKGVI